MTIRTLALGALALASTAAFAATHSAATPNGVAPMVAYLETSYGGEVVAIELDAAGDKPAHYHVDLAYPESGVARIDVDAATRAIASRDESPAVGFSLPQAAAIVNAHVGGDVMLAEMDASFGAPPHYDVDVRLPGGDVARLKVDAATGRIDWRTPPIEVR